MTKDKKSFLLYCDLYETVKKLNNETAGELLKHILAYVNDENPETENQIVDIVFTPIKQQLKRDLVKYEDISKKNSESARMRWDAVAQSALRTDAKHADTDTDTDTDTVIDNDIKKKKRGLLMKDVINPFENIEGFESLWQLWTDYRKEKRISAYKPIGLQGAFKKLWELSGGNIEIATKIIHESISNGWTGLFELKNNGKQTTESIFERIANS